jgi:hypothetical protein
MTAVLQWFLAVVFSGAAATKLSGRERFVRTLATLPWLSVRGARGASVGIPALELSLAIALVAARPVGAIASLVALCLFTAVIGVELAAGREFRCGCFGGADGAPVGWWTVARNLVLAAAAAFVAAFPASAAIGAALVGVAIGLVFLLVEVSAEAMTLARSR